MTYEPKSGLELMVTSPKRLSPELFQELPRFHREFLRIHARRGDEPCAADYVHYGHIADLPLLGLLRLIPWVGETKPEALTEIGKFVDREIRDNNAEFFQHLACILRARRQGVPLAKIQRKVIGVKLSKGRKKSLQDLSIMVPMAIHRLLLRRNHIIGGENPSDRCISRAELKFEIVCEQGNAGREDLSFISDAELSRWIGKTGIAKFMGPNPPGFQSALELIIRIIVPAATASLAMKRSAVGDLP